MPRTNKPPSREWRRMDLHLHTPASADYKQPNISYLDFLLKCEEKNLDIIAFADHNTVSGFSRFLQEFESLEMLERLKRLRDDERKRLQEYHRLREEILILPGFEITATLGFHVLCVFPQETTVRELEHLLLSLNVPPDKLDQGSGEVGATTDVLTAYRVVNQAGGLVIAAHANSSHGVAMPGFDFGGQTRIAYTQDANLHALEVTDLESKSRRRTAVFFSGRKPEYPRRMHCIQGSDAHKLDFDPRYKNEMGVGDRATEILLDGVSFNAIKQVFLGNDFNRTRPASQHKEVPFDPLRDAREQGNTLIQSFHERLEEKRGIARKVLEDVVALANTNGGVIYIGASANARAAVVGVDRPEHAITELRGAVSRQITPPIELQIDVLKSQNRNVLQVIVPRGTEAPYALEGVFIYVRSEDETTLATRDEIIQLTRDALAFQGIGSAPAAAAIPVPARSESKSEGEKEPVALAADPPKTGVEIVSCDTRKGVAYYAVRDLRNARIVQNVTRSSARKLWQYAIEQQEKNPCKPDKVTWIGDIGLWNTHKRGGKVRYDLVQRAGGKMFVYYGVTEDGIHGPWWKLVGGESGTSEETSAVQEEQAGIETTPEVAPVENTFAESTDEETRVEILEPESESLLALEPTAHAQSETELVAERPADSAPVRVDEMPISSAIQVVASPAPVEIKMPEPVIPEEPPVSEATSEPKTRAQEWREELERAMAEARAAQEAAQSEVREKKQE